MMRSHGRGPSEVLAALEVCTSATYEEKGVSVLPMFPMFSILLSKGHTLHSSLSEQEADMAPVNPVLYAEHPLILSAVAVRDDARQQPRVRTAYAGMLTHCGGL